ncbi:2OG-Fe(II) oxygenase [Dactylosporangium sp. AC04546]|uniref:2OG-Fe(II) oxygenase n=1 Tax=Dactylosporangium sp. AC04546 TaxID=2862460 RepID=UPI001EDCC428|nr:2OG-Fe(II) oxygenase [Dactylosporangium sp. AC04546]WVK78790.1 2OG-Fe(II) oxygenase [Dactylosporangium sp. AC04546]
MSTAAATRKKKSDRWHDRVESADWTAITEEVNEYGGALLPQLLTPEETLEIRELYEQDDLFRSTINMGPHRFGEGQYRYFNAPYPEPIERLKQALYPRLLPIARDWWTKLGRPAPWPDTLDLNEPGVDHTGGEFLLLEQRPRAQSRGTATLLPHGHGYLFTTRDRPVESARGWSAAPVRHGVSAVRSGERHTLALVFHDAA